MQPLEPKWKIHESRLKYESEETKKLESFCNQSDIGFGIRSGNPPGGGRGYLRDYEA
jgi:hypothetical protein